MVGYWHGYLSGARCNASVRIVQAPASTQSRRVHFSTQRRVSDLLFPNDFGEDLLHVRVYVVLILIQVMVIHLARLLKKA